MSKRIAASGLSLALAAAALLGGATLSTAAQAADAKVQCAGINSCKGTSECKTASNECKGQNSCKGHGWLSKSKAECMKLGGKVLGQ
ncbi:hypothetical protein [Leeia sp.]|uniref:BufA2 family periplasmic bufferin-type metallophore n=1 Tax=Leeia sp. TaxID=2884678 RepID=UPI0035B077A1